MRRAKKSKKTVKKRVKKTVKKAVLLKPKPAKKPARKPKKAARKPVKKAVRKHVKKKPTATTKHKPLTDQHFQAIDLLIEARYSGRPLYKDSKTTGKESIVTELGIVESTLYKWVNENELFKAEWERRIELYLKTLRRVLPFGDRYERLKKLVELLYLTPVVSTNFGPGPDRINTGAIVGVLKAIKEEHDEGLVENLAAEVEELRVLLEQLIAPPENAVSIDKISAKGDG